jgi:hypothetical protein
MQQNQLTIAVKMQSPITGSIALASHLMQAVKQIEHPLEMSEALDVLVLNLATSHASDHAREK